MKKSRPNNLLLIPLPISSIKKQIIAALIIGLSVFLILLMFQPFGTFGYQMKHKTLFLAGYGIICTIVYTGYYSLFMLLFKKWFNQQRWNLLKEFVTLIPLLLLMSLAALFYHNRIIGGYPIRLIDVFYFFRIGFAVALIPFSVLIYLKWMRARFVSIKQSEDNESYSITFESNNKTEKPVTLESENLLYLRSDGNYLEITEKKQEKPHIIRNSLNYVESKLSEKDFLRIHRSYIVNVKIIENLIITGSTYNLKLKDCDVKLPVSRSKVKELRNIIAS